jgi:hypothetical protein
MLISHVVLQQELLQGLYCQWLLHQAHQLLFADLSLTIRPDCQVTGGTNPRDAVTPQGDSIGCWQGLEQ